MHKTNTLIVQHILVIVALSNQIISRVTMFYIACGGGGGSLERLAQHAARWCGWPRIGTTSIVLHPSIHPFQFNLSIRDWPRRYIHEFSIDQCTLCRVDAVNKQTLDYHCGLNLPTPSVPYDLHESDMSVAGAERTILP